MTTYTKTNFILFALLFLLFITLLYPDFVFAAGGKFLKGDASDESIWKAGGKYINYLLQGVVIISGAAFVYHLGCATGFIGNKTNAVDGLKITGTVLAFSGVATVIISNLIAVSK